jgi:hypothetical protein
MVVCAAISARKSGAMAKSSFKYIQQVSLGQNSKSNRYGSALFCSMSSVFWILTGREYEPSSLAAARLA